ncbi:MAG: helix-turn-helix transcriptional regulator [Candidatus Shapirobacteria bacterium]|nr:helix-turn-helix transcriptional regulator [Candidatus Shapirobacteria bacterium]
MKNKQNLSYDDENLSFRNKLKVFRAMHELTQEQLAEKIGVSRQTVNAIEADKYLPSLGLAFKIAKLFKVKIEEVFVCRGGTDES